MKASTIIAVLTFTAAHAAAVAEAEPRIRWNSCGVPGESCAKVKRAALAVAEAIAEAEPRIRWNSCGVPGESCAKAKRSLEELGSTTQSILDDVLSRDQDETAIAQKNKLFHAGFPGSVHSKREANPRIRWNSCGVPGESCAKVKRGIQLIKEDYPTVHKDECFAEGGECHTILKAQAAFKDTVKREAEPRIRWNSCGVPGESCARGIPEVADAIARRDPTALRAVEECNGPNGDCTAADKLYAQLEAALDKAVDEAHKA